MDEPNEEKMMDDEKRDIAVTDILLKVKEYYPELLAAFFGFAASQGINSVLLDKLGREGVSASGLTSSLKAIGKPIGGGMMKGIFILNFISTTITLASVATVHCLKEKRKGK